MNPSPFLRAPLKKTVIEMKRVDTPMTFCFTNLCLSEWNGSCVVSVKQNMNLNRPPCSYFLFLAKVVLLKVVRPLKIYQLTKVMVPS
jgi:hypothetical protein